MTRYSKVFKKMKDERDEFVANGGGSSTEVTAPVTPSSRKRKNVATPTAETRKKLKTKTNKQAEPVKEDDAEDVGENATEVKRI
jgi:hypothetical protein